MTAPTTLDITTIADAIDAAENAAEAAQTAVTALAANVAADVANATAAINALESKVATNTAAIQTIQAGLTKIATEIGAGTTTPPVTTPPVTTPPVTTPPVTTPPVTPPVTTAPVSGIDLSTGLKDFGTQTVPFSPLPKPAKGQTVNDPDFPGVTIMRITDAATDFKATNCIPVYPTTQAWNCDESRFVLYCQGGNGGGNYPMFDGTTGKFIKMLAINPADVEQFYWSKTDPTAILYIDNRQASGTWVTALTSLNVETGVATVLHDFQPDLKARGWPAQGPVRCGYPLANYGDNEIWGLGSGGIPNVDSELGLNVFGWERSTGKITIYQSVKLAQARGSTPFPRLSGKGWIWNDNTDPNDANYTTWLLDGNGAVLAKVPVSADEHGDSALDSAGNDYWVSVQFDTAVPGNLIAANLTTGKISTLLGQANGFGYPRTGSLVGACAWKNPAWAVTGMTGTPTGLSGGTLLDQEIAIGNVETGVVRRVAHHRSTGYYTSAPTNNYWAQPNVCLSPSGTRILFTSDWGNADPKNPVVNPNASSDAYLLTLPAYKG